MRLILILSCTTYIHCAYSYWAVCYLSSTFMNLFLFAMVLLLLGNFYPMCRRVMRSDVFVCVFMSQNRLFGILLVKNVRKSTHAAFLSYLDIVNATLNCWFTPGWVPLPFLCLWFLCPLVVAGPWDQMLGMLWGLVSKPQCWQRNVTLMLHFCYSTELSVRRSHDSPLTVLSVHRVCVLWNSSELHAILNCTCVSIIICST